MPEMSGLDVIREVKQHKELPDVLVVTAYDSTDVTKEALDLGALDYMPKPFELKTFQLKVKEILEKKGKYKAK